MGKVVIVEGIIGAGKTTFSELLAEALCGTWLREPDEKNGNPYLGDFYNDPKRWALTMQLHLLNTRFRMHQHAQWTAMQTDNSVVLDRSYFGDTAFARLQLKNGTLNKDEFETYKLCYHNMTSSVLLPQICVYLKTKPEVSQQRIKKRMEIQTGRQCENVIDIEYLKGLETEEKLMVETLEKQGVHIIPLEWNEDLSLDQIKGVISKVASSINDFSIPDMFLNLHRRTI